MGWDLKTKARQMLAFVVFLAAMPLTAQTTTQVYSFTVPAPAAGVGYAPNGNLLSYNDSVNGNWTLGYDALNRLASASVATGPYAGTGLTMTYDSFGNRVGRYIGSASTSGGVTTVTITNISGLSSGTGYSAYANKINRNYGTNLNRNGVDNPFGAGGPMHNVTQTFTASMGALCPP